MIPEGLFPRPTLNEAGALLRFRVIHDGRIVYERHPRARVRFESGVMRDYFDWRYYSMRDAGQALDRIARRGLA